MKKRKKAPKKHRLPKLLAITVALHSGSGVHRDKKRAQDKKACRGKVNSEQERTLPFYFYKKRTSFEVL